MLTPHRGGNHLTEIRALAVLINRSRLLKDLRPPQSFTPLVAGHFEARLTQFELHTNSWVTSESAARRVRRTEVELLLDFRNEVPRRIFKTTNLLLLSTTNNHTLLHVPVSPRSHDSPEIRPLTSSNLSSRVSMETYVMRTNVASRQDIFISPGHDQCQPGLWNGS
ncbi:unnamed protein product [Pleuronectes platessa]|uniref:Uncharacterized protein n=1 Tax=Pleuronectes platessa TaxID=8262 RepID=A0A9N7TW41_PLEPL|nr:unnamed protein product [Pleuronectes platessa]